MSSGPFDLAGACAEPGPDLSRLATGALGDLGALGGLVREARLAPLSLPERGAWPHDLHPLLFAALGEAGLGIPFAHQAEVVAGLLRGEDLALVTPTASGKSLAWMVPALQTLLLCPHATVLYLAPSKALARDQWDTLGRLAGRLGGDLAAQAIAIDGDSTPAERSAARARGRVLLTNPEMLHHVLLPSHPRWARFLGGISLLVLDEAHQYRGLPGAHLASLLWRLERVVARHRGPEEARRPITLFAASATIANPDEHLGRLTGRQVRVVRGQGSLRGPQVQAVGEPRLLDGALGIRRTLREEAVAAAAALGAAGLRTILFTRTRREAEEVLQALRDATGDPELARLYRAGLDARQRRAVEEELRQGTRAVVVATSALELGVDPGPVDACVIAGYPGSITSFRQQAGRAGRREKPSLVLFLAGPGPLDQYLLGRPALLWDGEVEHARCDPWNPLVRLAHLRCAAQELPLAGLGDAILRPPEPDPPEPVLLEALLARAELREEVAPGKGRRWRWMGPQSPHRSVSLRGGEGDPVEIRLGSPPGEGPPQEGAVTGPPRRRGRQAGLLGTVEAREATSRLHPGAVLLQGGAAFRVTTLDLTARRAWVVPDPGLTRTAAEETLEVTLLSVRQAAPLAEGSLGHGVVGLRRAVEGFREWEVGSGRRIRQEALEMPALELEAAAWWLELGEGLARVLEERGLLLTLNAQSAAGRGPGWARQRRLVRERDGHRCRSCGAPEPAGREHQVHHRRPFRLFGWVPGANLAYEEANRLENLVLLCPGCHHRAEAGLRGVGLLHRLGELLRQVASLLLMADPRDLDALVLGPDGGEAGEPQQCKPPPGGTLPGGTSLARLLLLERAAGGAGLAEALFRRRALLFENARELLRACRCEAGCPACAGPPDEDVPRPREAILGLLDALETPQAPQAPQALEAPQALHAPQTPQAPQAPQAPNIEASPALPWKGARP